MLIISCSRAAETIGAITEPVSGDVLMADQIAKSLKGRGIGIRVKGYRCYGKS